MVAMRKYMQTRHCLYCGPRTVLVHDQGGRSLDFIPCPTCHLDPGEVRMIEDVRARGFEACYRDEVRRGR